MHTRLALAPILLLAILLITPIGAAASTATVTIDVQSFTAQFTLQVYNATLSLAANTTQSITVSLPSNWTSSDIQAVIVHVNTDQKLSLAAKDANGTQIAAADVIPLSSGYTVTLPPETATIDLTASQAAQASVTVYLQSVNVTFTLTPSSDSITVYPNDPAWMSISVKQTGGPKVYVYFNLDYNRSNGFTASIFQSDKATPYNDATNGKWTSGQGWTDTAYLRLYWDGSGNDTSKQVKIILYADPDGYNGPYRPMSVAVINLAGSFPVSSTEIVAKLEQNKMALYGVGIVVFLILVAAVLFGGKGRRGGIAPSLLLLLVFAAALAIAVTVVRPEMAAAMGVGIAVFLILLLLQAKGKVKVSL